MVNFGLRLNKSTKPSWTKEYVRYDALKQLISGLCAGTVQMEKFNEELAASLVSVNEQCKQREAQLKQIKSTLSSDHTNMQNTQATEDLKCRLALLSEQVDELRHYINWNYMAVIKIVKKRNKNCNSTPLDAEAILLKQHFYTSAFVTTCGTFATLLAAKLNGQTPDPREFSCSICLDALTNPVSLPCNHRFCFECISKCAHLNDEAGMVVSCALCRRHVLFCSQSFKVDTTLTTFLVNDLGFAPRRAPCLPDEMTCVTKRQKVEDDPMAMEKTDNANKPCPLQPGHSAPPSASPDSIFTDLAHFFGIDGFGSPNLKPLPPKVSPEKEMSTTDEAGIPLPVNHAPFEPTKASPMPICNQQDFKVAGHTSKSGPVTARDLTQIEILLEMHLDNTNLKPVGPTKSGRRRRMIPLKTLDHQVGLVRKSKKPGAVKQKLLDLNAGRERNRQAAQIFRVRDQQYVAQLQEAIQRLETRNNELTELQAKLLEQKELDSPLILPEIQPESVCVSDNWPPPCSSYIHM